MPDRQKLLGLIEEAEWRLNEHRGRLIVAKDKQAYLQSQHTHSHDRYHMSEIRFMRKKVEEARETVRQWEALLADRRQALEDLDNAATCRPTFSSTTSTNSNVLTLNSSTGTIPISDLTIKTSDIATGTISIKSIEGGTFSIAGEVEETPLAWLDRRVDAIRKLGQAA